MSTGDKLTEAVELLRGVIHECNRLLRLHPTVLLTPSAHPRVSPGLGRASPPDFAAGADDRGSSPGVSNGAREHEHERVGVNRATTTPATLVTPSTFHYMYGAALFLLGKIIGAEPSLAKDGEPAGSPAFYLAALDVFEMGENLPRRWDEHGSSREDWRMAVVWGRCLVCLADEKLGRMENTNYGLYPFTIYHLPFTIPRPYASFYVACSSNQPLTCSVEQRLVTRTSKIQSGPKTQPLHLWPIAVRQLHAASPSKAQHRRRMRSSCRQLTSFRGACFTCRTRVVCDQRTSTSTSTSTTGLAVT